MSNQPLVSEPPDLAGDWTLGGGSGFGEVSPQDERMHPMPPRGDSVTETWAYMWYVPEARLTFYAYVWVHPNLGVATSGLFGCQGVKNTNLGAEMFDIEAYLGDSFVGDGLDVQAPNGLHIAIDSEFEHIQLDYDDPGRGNSAHVTMTAGSPPIARENGFHFDQVTRCRGSVSLRGATYEVDCFGMRDRSWGQLRPERPVAGPPYTWMTCTFRDAGFSWHVSGTDDVARNPHWLGKIDAPARSAHDGWLWRDGELTRLASSSVLVTRDPQTLRPVSQSVNFTDVSGRRYEVLGKVIAGVPWNGWPNMTCWVTLTEWSLDGDIGYGDTQEVQWNDFIHQFRTDQG